MTLTTTIIVYIAICLHDRVIVSCCSSSVPYSCSFAILRLHACMHGCYSNCMKYNYFILSYSIATYSYTVHGHMHMHLRSRLELGWHVASCYHLQLYIISYIHLNYLRRFPACFVIILNTEVTGRIVLYSYLPQLVYPVSYYIIAIQLRI